MSKMSLGAGLRLRTDGRRHSDNEKFAIEDGCLNVDTLSLGGHSVGDNVTGLVAQHVVWGEGEPLSDARDCGVYRLRR
jgi:hypothetical protein